MFVVHLCVCVPMQVQSWLYIPGEPVGDPTSLSARVAATVGRPTRTVGSAETASFTHRHCHPHPLPSL